MERSSNKYDINFHFHKNILRKAPYKVELYYIHRKTTEETIKDEY